MNNIRKYTAWLGAGAIMITLATGCADKNNNAVPDAAGNVAESAVESTGNVADAAADTTGNMVDGAANTMAPVGDAMANGANTAVDATGNVANAAVDATGNVASAAGDTLSNLADAATMTPKVKTALAGAPALDGSKINVDTLGSKDTIALRGTVTSAAQKTLAESIAKQNAPGYKIANQLTMKGAM